MRPCKLVIFGNPNAGTPLMLASLSVALDLPLKTLVWEKSDTTVWSWQGPDTVWRESCRGNEPAPH
jgi:uncharacterized protein (DUF302 family)